MAQLEFRNHIELQGKNQRVLKDYQNKIQRTNSIFHKQSVTNDVTCFNNMRLLDKYLDHYLSQPSSKIEKFTLVFFDMDNFKHIVDMQGCLFGDKVLDHVAKVVHSLLDIEDHIFLSGGDEYIVILPNQGSADALSKVEAMRKKISSTSYLQGEKSHPRITASFGLATFPDDAREKIQLLMVADQCLFQSKKNGKNRISIWGK